MRQIEHPAIFEVLYPKKLVAQIQANGGIEHEVKFYQKQYGLKLDATIQRDGSLYIANRVNGNKSKQKI